MEQPDDFNFHDWFVNKTLPILIKGINRIIETGEQHSPILMVFGYEKGDVVPIVIPDFGDRESKDLVADMQKTVCQDVANVAATVFMSEVWRKSYDSIEEGRKAHDLELEPIKEEAMMINAMHGDEQLIVIFPIDRDRKCLGEPEITNPHDDPRTTGRMVNK